MNLLEIMPLEIRIKSGGPKLTDFACVILYFSHIYFLFLFHTLKIYFKASYSLNIENLCYSVSATIQVMLYKHVDI